MSPSSSSCATVALTRSVPAAAGSLTVSGVEFMTDPSWGSRRSGAGALRGGPAGVLRGRLHSPGGSRLRTLLLRPLLADGLLPLGLRGAGALGLFVQTLLLGLVLLHRDDLA